MDFELIEEIRDVEIIAVDRSIRDVARLQRSYGKGRWRKLRGYAKVRLRDMAQSVLPNYIGMKHMESAGRK